MLLPYCQAMCGCQCWQHWVCGKSSMSHGFLMTIIHFNPYLITKFFGHHRIIYLIFFLLVYEISSDVAKRSENTESFPDIGLLIIESWVFEYPNTCPSLCCVKLYLLNSIGYIEEITVISFIIEQLLFLKILL